MRRIINNYYTNKCGYYAKKIEIDDTYAAETTEVTYAIIKLTEYNREEVIGLVTKWKTNVWTHSEGGGPFKKMKWAAIDLIEGQKSREEACISDLLDPEPDDRHPHDIDYIKISTE